MPQAVANRSRPPAPGVTALLTIAGTDPTGGAGLTADLQVFRDFGCLGLAVPTAVIDQDSAAVHAQLPLDAQAVGRMTARVLAGGRPAAVKVGLLSAPDVAAAAAEALRGTVAPVVLDPVLASGRGDRLAQDGLVAVLRRDWLPNLASLLTPNVPEAEQLLGRPIRDEGEAAAAAAELAGLGRAAVLLKGGHLPGAPGDWLAHGGRVDFLPRRGTFPGDIHGTGCHLSAAIAALLGLGWGLTEAVAGGRGYLWACAAQAVRLGGEAAGRLLIGHGDDTRQAARDTLAARGGGW